MPGQKAGDDCTDEQGESLVAIDPQLTPWGLLQRARRLVGLFELVQDLGTALVIFAADLGQIQDAGWCDSTAAHPRRFPGPAPDR